MNLHNTLGRYLLQLIALVFATWIFLQVLASIQDKIYAVIVVTLVYKAPYLEIGTLFYKVPLIK